MYSVQKLVGNQFLYCLISVVLKQQNLVHSLLKCNAVQKMIYCMVKQLIKRVFTWFSIEQLDFEIDNCSTFWFCSIIIKLRNFLGTENQNRFIFMLLIKTGKYSFVEMWGNEKWKNENSTKFYKSLLRNLLPRWINPIGSYRIQPSDKIR